MYFHGRVLRRCLTFIVDTAAQTSLIIPSDERVLASNNQHAALDTSFIRGIRPVRTILGEANFKYLSGPNTGIALPDIAGNPISIDLPYLHFADEQKPTIAAWKRRLMRLAHVWSLPGEGAEFSFLGRDVLQQYALYSCIQQQVGFLTDDPTFKAHLSSGISPVAGAIAFFEGENWGS